jgi:hypothetical protein
MKALIFLALLASACTPSPPEFSKPAENAPVWDLNVGEWQGTNAMIRPPVTPEPVSLTPLGSTNAR